MIEVKVPDIGDFADVPVIEILVEPDQEVAAEDPLLTLESDKATMDVPAPEGGVVKQLMVKVGDRVSEGTPLLKLEPASSDGDEPEPEQEDEPEQEEEPEAEKPEPEKEQEDAPPDEPLPDADHQAQVVVIGAGPGGYSAAFRAADLGLKTILVERYETLGGVCLNVGCIPSKALLHAARVVAEAEEFADRGISFGKPKIDAAKLLGWKQEVVSRLTGGLKQMAKQRKVEVLTGTAKFTGAHTIDVDGKSVAFEHCIIAAGSSAVSLPFLPEGDERIMTSTGALELTDIPKRLLVIGGGIIGLEMATVYDALGSQVTVVELLDQLIPGADKDLVRPLQKRISERYEAIRLGTKVTGAKARKDSIEVSFEGDDKPARFDRVLVAVGRRPNGGELDADKAGVKVDDKGFIPVDDQLRTNVPHIFAIGDVVGEPMLAHKASHEGHVAAEVIAGENVSFDARTIPSVAYTDPEVAWMGLTETRAKEEGIEYEKATFPWAASGRALSLGRPDGTTKLLFEPGTRRLLGAGIVGVNAGDLIAETVHALEMGSDAEDIALTVHPHPTLSESVMLASEAALGTITDLYLPKRAKSKS